MKVCNVVSIGCTAKVQRCMIDRGFEPKKNYAGLPDLPKSDGLFVDNATELMQVESRARGGRSLEIESSSAQLRRLHRFNRYHVHVLVLLPSSLHSLLFSKQRAQRIGLVNQLDHFPLELVSNP